MRDYEGHAVFNPLYLFYLESPDRDRWQKPDEVLQALGLRAGDVVADIGAGGGYFTEKLARRLAPSGHVYATDVQEVMIKNLRKRVAQQALTNVTVIRAGFDDPMLPSASCDLALFSSVYKEIQEREEYMKKIRTALKQNGRVAILEYRPEEPSPGPPRRYRLPETRVVAEMEAAGFRLLDRFEFLPREYFLVFGVRS
jgi:ubiquinone/menaquinone biosynthesis C-methylase UbiE